MTKPAHLRNGILSCLLFSFLIGYSQIKVSSNQRFLVSAKDETPFFWLGDTGWLLFVKCTREDALAYLDIRREQGFNVIQVMLLHEMKNAVNAYGHKALIDNDAAKPLVTDGNNPSNADEYDYWDHVEFIVDEAA